MGHDSLFLGMFGLDDGRMNRGEAFDGRKAFVEVGLDELLLVTGVNVFESSAGIEGDLVGAYLTTEPYFRCSR